MYRNEWFEREQRKDRWFFCTLIGILIAANIGCVLLTAKLLRQEPVGTEVAPTNVSRARTSSDPVQAPWVRTSADPKFVAPPQEWETEAYKQRERDRERETQDMMLYQATQPFYR